MKNDSIQQKIQAKRSFLDSTMTLWGWLFDLFTVMVNLSTIVSDILVCQEFARDGEWVWFGLVLASLVIGNVVFTSLFLFIWNSQPIFRALLSFRAPLFVKFIIILPFAQLIPLVAWIYHYFAEWRRKRHQIALFRKGECSAPKADVGSKLPDDWAGEMKMTTGAGTEEVANVVGAFHTMGRLEGAIKEHLKTHIFFYVETVVESIPQVVIQLLAITFLQKVTTIQVVSMISSLLSIISKGYVVASSQTISAVVWKFFCCAADLFGLFYIFSSIMDRSAPQEVALFVPEAPRVTWMTALFVYKWTAYIGITAFFGLLLIIHTLIFRPPRFTCNLFKDLLFAGSLGTILAGPAMIGIETVKFSSLVFLLTQFESTQSRAASALVYSYLTTGTVEERARKAKHLLFQLTKLGMDLRLAQIAKSNEIAAARIQRYGGRIPPPLKKVSFTAQELQLSYWCESTSDEEPSDWEDEMAISAAQSKHFARQQAKQQAITEGFQQLVKDGATHALDMINSPEYMIPAGTDYDTYLKLYIGGSSARAERIQRRRQLRKGLYGNPAEDSSLKIVCGPARLLVAEECNGVEMTAQPINVSNGDSNNGERPTRVTKYSHRLPFRLKGIDEIFNPSKLSGRGFDFSPNWGSLKWENVSLGILAVVYVIMIFFGQLFSAVFPLVNYPLYFHSQNLLQQMCFICYAVCLAVILVLLPSVIRYGLFSQRFQAVRNTFYAAHNVENIFRIIENEHLPSMEAIVKDFSCGNIKHNNNNPDLSEQCNPTLLTAELASVVASYMQPSDLDLRGLGQQECKRIKDLHRR